jgi:predicted dehydrogenase
VNVGVEKGQKSRNEPQNHNDAVKSTPRIPIRAKTQHLSHNHSLDINFVTIVENSCLQAFVFHLDLPTPWHLLHSDFRPGIVYTINPFHAMSNSKTGIGFIGLSAGGGWASTAHLPYLNSSDKFEIIALTNSSKTSAQEAMSKYHIQNASAYDSVEEMVKNPRVKLVVCAVAVFSHYQLVKPALEAGKDVYVEWPLGASTKEAEELTALAKEKAVRTFVGLQGRASNLVTTLQRLLNSGEIGKPLVSQMSGSACTPETGTKLPPRYSYFKDRDAEGTTGQVMLNIYIGHTIDYMATVIGEPATVSAGMRTTWPIVDLMDGDKVLESGIVKTADDYVALQGTTVNGTTYVYNMRGGDAFISEEGFVWDIIGDSGQIRVTGSTIMANLGAEDYQIRVKDDTTGKIKDVDLDSSLDVPLAAQNVGKLYESYAAGDSMCTFEDALQRHKFLDGVFEAAGNSKIVTL